MFICKSPITYSLKKHSLFTMAQKHLATLVLCLPIVLGSMLVSNKAERSRTTKLHTKEP